MARNRPRDTDKEAQPEETPVEELVNTSDQEAADSGEPEPVDVSGHGGCYQLVDGKRIPVKE